MWRYLRRALALGTVRQYFRSEPPFANNLHNGITAGLPGSLERFTASPKSLKFSFQSFSTKSGQLVGLVTRRSTVVLPGQHKTEAKERCAFDYRHPIKDWVFASRRHRGRTPIWGQAILRRYIRPAAHRAGIQKQFGWAHVQAYVLDSPAECRNRIQSRAGTGAAFSSAIHVGVYTQAITPAKHAAQAPCCHWFFQRELMEPRSHLQMLTLQRDENLRRAKRTQKRARKRALLGPRWF